VLVCGPLSAFATSAGVGSSPGIFLARTMSRASNFPRGTSERNCIFQYAFGFLPTPPTLHIMALVAYRNLLRSARIAFEGMHCTIRNTSAAHTAQAT
jgi:hypothetical protein